MFRTVFPSIIRSSSLYIQQYLYVKQILLLVCQKAGSNICLTYVRTWLREQEMSWYRESIHALFSRWRKAVDVDGNYVEK
jgi:hypothetical protein